MTVYIPYPEWLRPEVFEGVPLRWYGLMYLLAFGLTYLLVRRQSRELGVDASGEELLNVLFWGIVGMFIGARLAAVTLYAPIEAFLRRPWILIWPFDDGMRFTGLQGMSYHGGLLGATVGIVLYLRHRKMDLWLWADMITAAVPLGYTFGRLGNFINGELYGRVTAAPWGIVFPQAPPLPLSVPWVQNLAERVGMEISEVGFANLPRHPSQIYEALLEGVLLWAILWFWARRKAPFEGFVTSCYVIGYGIARFLVEYTRQPDYGIGYVFGPAGPRPPVERFVSPFYLSMGQVLSLGMILVGVGLLLWRKYQDKQRPQVTTYERGESQTE
ncbi:MAG: prolipoprotein diacylglyceryl transferase [Spirochaetaceae bacterium]